MGCEDEGHDFIIHGERRVREGDDDDPFDLPCPKRKSSRLKRIPSSTSTPSDPPPSPPQSPAELPPIPFRWRGTQVVVGSGLFPDCWRVLTVTPESAKRNKHFVASVLDKMSAALGRAPGVTDHTTVKLFFLVAPLGGIDAVCGAIEAERLSKAWRMIDASEEDRQLAALQSLAHHGSPEEAAAAAAERLRNEKRDEGKEGVDWAKQPHVESLLDSGTGCLCGIHRIWVEPEARRRGYATELIDAARKSLVFGYEIPREHCAFSQPTVDGKLLARACTGRSDFYVYA